MVNTGGQSQPTQLGYTPIGVYNGPIPKEGPKVVPVSVNFATNNTFPIDFTLLFQRGVLSEIQAVWIDNTGNNANVTLTNLQTNQVIDVPAGFQGTVPVFASNPPQFKAQSAGNGPVQFMFLNVPIISQNWNAGSQAFEFDASGYLEVDDVTLNTLMASLANGTGQLNVSEFVTTNGDTIQPRFEGSKLYNGNTNSGAAQTIIAGSVNWFITFAEILVSPDAAIAAAGEFTVNLNDSGTGSVIASGICYLPSASPTITQATAPVLVILLEDFEYIGRQAGGGNLTLTCSTSLSAGKVFWNVAGGTTAKIGT
jgi:hypothetical protein